MQEDHFHHIEHSNTPSRCEFQSITLGFVEYNLSRSCPLKQPNLFRVLQEVCITPTIVVRMLKLDLGVSFEKRIGLEENQALVASSTTRMCRHSFVDCLNLRLDLMSPHVLFSNASLCFCVVDIWKESPIYLSKHLWL